MGQLPRNYHSIAGLCVDIFPVRTSEIAVLQRERNVDRAHEQSQQYLSEVSAITSLRKEAPASQRRGMLPKAELKGFSHARDSTAVATDTYGDRTLEDSELATSAV